MRKKIVFKIKIKGMRKWLVESATIDVPDNWDDMNEDEQREYLITPIASYEHQGQTLFTPSRFQKATGIEEITEEVVDFEFTTSPNPVCSRPPTARASDAVGDNNKQE